MTLWPTPNEHFKNLTDVEVFLKHSFVEINDQMDSLEKNIEADDDGVTYEWVDEQLDDNVTRLEAIINELESRVTELERKCEKLE